MGEGRGGDARVSTLYRCLSLPQTSPRNELASLLLLQSSRALRSYHRHHRHQLWQSLSRRYRDKLLVAGQGQGGGSCRENSNGSGLTRTLRGGMLLWQRRVTVVQLVRHAVEAGVVRSRNSHPPLRCPHCHCRRRQLRQFQWLRQLSRRLLQQNRTICGHSTRRARAPRA